MNKQAYSELLTVVILIICAALTRFFPHPPNFTAIGAMAIFGGSIIQNKKIALLIPVSALLVSDIALNFISGVNGFYGLGQFFIYGSFMLITALSMLIRKRNFLNIAFASIWSGVIFFIISNFGVWVSSQVAYPHTFSGLISCYTAAIPFYQNEFFGNFGLNAIYGNLFFSGVLFGIYAVLQNSFATAKKSI